MNNETIKAFSKIPQEWRSSDENEWGEELEEIMEAKRALEYYNDLDDTELLEETELFVSSLNQIKE
jgi:hypothetical protein